MIVLLKVLYLKIITKREELLLRVVLALPYASNTGLAETICSSKLGLFASFKKVYWNWYINFFF